MRRNSGDRFGTVAQDKEIKRSEFKNVKYNILTTGNAGYLYPLGSPIEVLPGDTFSSASAGLIKFQTPLVQVMDKAYVDTFWFFVPWTQIWEDTKHFFGESEVAGFEPQGTYKIPMTYYTPDNWAAIDDKSYTGYASKTLIDYFGLPTATYGTNNVNGGEIEVSVLPFRAYNLIWNNFFRDQNLQDALPVYKSSKINDKELLKKGGTYTLRKVNKLHDYFTSALPYAQKTDPITLNLSTTNQLPIYAGEQLTNTQMDKYYSEMSTGSTKGTIWRAYPNDSSTLPSTQMNLILDSTQQGDNVNNRSMTVGEKISTKYESGTILPNNLWADASVGLGAIDIISLRMAFAMQRLYENLALHGSRYYEYIRGSFGITVPELNIDVPEYLGGCTSTIGMQAVKDTSSAGLGDIGAMSVTSISNKDFDKTFTQHGYIIGLYCVRNRNSYQQGVARLWKKTELLDIYQPELANVGEQPIYNYEICCAGNYDDGGDGHTSKDYEIFGYQERYAEYRYFPNQIMGEFRSNSENTMDMYHYGDIYESTPKLSAEWIESEATNIGRTLSIEDPNVRDQFYSSFQICFDMKRKMPLYGGHSMQGWY